MKKYGKAYKITDFLCIIMQKYTQFKNSGSQI